eukprot:CAMPEP_0180546934 /NCGR_PEP_ID=MMETSP1036_2-20121128/70819_1 /TAXON_ID=632150 /ORGANISM="Azadinium spinosum, Strain 3D9" /LENGTH=240 /DNA_ID=CAMNT_0022562039 /DNA_START=140 /DNA_END=863 /DNA_ORIENTATION=-
MDVDVALVCRCFWMVDGLFRLDPSHVPLPGDDLAGDRKVGCSNAPAGQVRTPYRHGAHQVEDVLLCPQHAGELARDDAWPLALQLLAQELDLRAGLVADLLQHEALLPYDDSGCLSSHQEYGLRLSPRLLALGAQHVRNLSVNDLLHLQALVVVPDDNDAAVATTSADVIHAWHCTAAAVSLISAPFLSRMARAKGSGTVMCTWSTSGRELGSRKGAFVGLVVPAPAAVAASAVAWVPCI